MNKSAGYFVLDASTTAMQGLSMVTSLALPKPYRPVEWSSLSIIPVPRSIYSFLAVFMTFVMVSSAILTGIVIAATKKFQNMRKPVNYLLLNLAVADLLSATLGGIPTIGANLSGYYVMGKYACWGSAFLVGTFGIIDLISITILSFSRYLITCRPAWFTEFRRTHAWIGVAFTWFWSICWHIPPLFWDGYDLHGVGTSCGAKWTWTGPESHIYLILYFTFCFFIPLLILIFSYASIAQHIRKTNRNSSLGQHITRKTGRKTTKMIMTILVAFLLCWTPYACVGLYTIFNPGHRINQYYSMVPAYLAKTATVYNPCVYILMNNKLRFNVCQILVANQPPAATSSAYDSSVSNQPTSQRFVAATSVIKEQRVSTKL